MVDVRLLAEVPEVIPAIAGWYRAEWSDWFGDTSLDEIEADFASIANKDRLPLGRVAFGSSVDVMGVCALRDEPFDPYPRVGPWLRGLYVHG